MDNNSTTPGAVREAAISLMDRALAMDVRLSEDDSAYGLIYISQKLAKVSSHMESLGDISMSLTKMGLEVSRRKSLSKSQYALKERTFKSDPTYVNGDRNEKGSWLQGKLEVFRNELEDWELTHLYLTEIRVAVDDRIQLFKRLDSDIRLQHKLLEAKIGAGAMGSNPTPKGSQGGNRFPSGSPKGINELDLD
jgi:hypothetical protein